MRGLVCKAAAGEEFFRRDFGEQMFVCWGGQAGMCLLEVTAKNIWFHLMQETLWIIIEQIIGKG